MRESDDQVTAVSRLQRPDEGNIVWQAAGFENFKPGTRLYDVVISLGPLDAFSTWLSSSGLVANHIVVLSSTSIITKKNSPDVDERKLARLLYDSELALIDHARKNAIHLIILRPTLIYGAGRDQTLSRWLNMANRFKFVVLPKNAGGLRQPVHVADVAMAVFQSMSLENVEPLVLDLPGGEILPFDQMLLRTLKVYAPTTLVLRIPNFLFRLMLRFASFVGLGRGLGLGFFARLGEDWVFDATQVQKVLGLHQRPFSL